MDYTTSVGDGLSQHRAADLTSENERRRSIAERLERRTPQATKARRPAWVPTGRQLRSPRFVLPTVAIALMGSILGFAAIPQDGAPVVPATVVPAVVDPPGPGFSGARFSLR
ncbi:hypothetical protein P0L94_05635 [Microbacter sp. GSS18]|nr:hypothetical protein P0L94_05635 [Microbacter sp. GSS18]